MKKLQATLWRKFIPLLQRKSASSGQPYDYFSTFFQDTDHIRYELKDYHSDQNQQVSSVSLTTISQEQTVEKEIALIPAMKSEIIHYKKATSSFIKASSSLPSTII